MSGVTDLSLKIEKRLPGELVGFMRLAGDMAQENGQKLYLVGGVVRDLLLGRENFDLDLVLEGDAINLARELSGVKPGKITTHPRFGTAKLQWDRWSVDLTTARAETYTRPGALPMVKPAAIRDDLFRRDFTINAMAVEISSGRYGRLLDVYGGRNDLKQKHVRVLHEKSFVDDATRIWRGLRYEQRLGFRLEPATLRWLKRDVAYLDMVSGDRIRRELELVLQEAYPEKVLDRAGELGVLSRLHPALKGDRGLAEKFEQARRLKLPGLSPIGLYLALLAYSLTGEENERLISYLRLCKSAARTLRDTIDLKARLKLLAAPGLTPSRVYALLHGYSPSAVAANFLAGDSPIASQYVGLFLKELCYVKPALGGGDLKKLGVSPGPRIKEILNRLLAARLDGKATTKQAERDLVRRWLGGEDSRGAA